MMWSRNRRIEQDFRGISLRRVDLAGSEFERLVGQINHTGGQVNSERDRPMIRHTALAPNPEPHRGLVRMKFHADTHGRAGGLAGRIGFPIIGVIRVDCDALDQGLADEGIELIAPHRANRKPEHKTQDVRPMRRYRRRWKVERTIAWLQNDRRLCIRWEKSSRMFQGMLHLRCTALLLKQVLG